MSLYTEEQLGLKLSASHQTITNFSHTIEKAVRYAVELSQNYASDLKNAQEKIKELNETYQKQIEELTEKNEEQATTILVLRQALNQRPQHEMTEMINVINSAVESGLIDKNGEIVEEGNNRSIRMMIGIRVLDSDSYDDNVDDNRWENSEDEQPTVTEDDKEQHIPSVKKVWTVKKLTRYPTKKKWLLPLKVMFTKLSGYSVV